ncbi:hypothetical protein F0562_013548 [Nyssa sinensis]|uniref:Uncharacterized protein n=1 Tax=Nyssa sinensis TaxID=561372 RepID=A0A5J4ZP78_9ASTE|nr:hypothetical protein F0562_013548 [Nyssa sinensis]
MQKNASSTILEQVLESKLTLNDQGNSSFNHGRGRGRGDGHTKEIGNVKRNVKVLVDVDEDEDMDKDEENSHLEEETPKTSSATATENLGTMPRIVGIESTNKLTSTSKVDTRHCSEIEAVKITAVEEQTDKILKLGRRLASDGYNLCLKKMAKAYPKVDIELLDHIEVSDEERKEYEGDKDPRN